MLPLTFVEQPEFVAFVKGKITGRVTDNATNFVKAFKEFGVTAFEEACAADSEDFELVTFEEIEPPGPLLSQHLRCACHTLSLIATADVKKAISANHALNRLHSSVMSKCSKYWGASGRPKSAEVVTSILGKQLPAPCITRWNSLHHALDVLTQNKEKLQDLSNELQLPSLKSSEIEFIEEYCTILKPIATGAAQSVGDAGRDPGVTLTDTTPAPSASPGTCWACKVVPDHFEGQNRVEHGRNLLGSAPAGRQSP
ncbi:uncharacterized protein ISCGN_013376 [Ixodes scapularis]